MIGRARDASAPFVFDLQTKQIKSLQFSPAGRLLASATAQTIAVLDVAGRRIVTSLCVAENGVYGFVLPGRQLPGGIFRPWRADNLGKNGPRFTPSRSIPGGAGSRFQC